MKKQSSVGTAVAVMVVSVALIATAYWVTSLPTVYESYPDGKVVCVLDADGKEIPKESIGDKYHFRYALECPSEK